MDDLFLKGFGDYRERAERRLGKPSQINIVNEILYVVMEERLALEDTLLLGTFKSLETYHGGVLARDRLLSIEKRIVGALKDYNKQIEQAEQED